MSIHHAITEAVNTEFLAWANKQVKDGSVLDISPAKYPSADQPFAVRSYGFEFEYPINPDFNKLPSITLNYGKFREGPEGIVQADSTIYTLVAHAVVKSLDGSEANGEPRTLLQSCNDMHVAMRRLYLSLLTMGLSTEDGTVDRIKMARGMSGEGKFTNYEYQQFYFDFYITEAKPPVFPTQDI